MLRKGICAAGNLIADIMHHIERYPKNGELTTILGARETTVGGLACNTALSLSMLDPDLPVQVCGILGDDMEGRFIRSRFSEHGSIDTSRIIVGGQTAYTLVMNDNESRQRTFFTSCGSGSQFDVDSIDLHRLPSRILHAGYILLLDALDGEDREYGTRMARLLHNAQQLGIKTSVDVVTETGDRFRRLVPPALKYTDYCVINELEAQQVTGVSLRSDSGTLLTVNMREALFSLRRFGVSTWAAIHCPEGAYGLDGQGTFVSLPSLKLPSGFIKGTTGAGDAFCAGTLYGAHEGWTLKDALRMGTAAAACSLNSKDSYSAIKSAPEAMAFYLEMGGE